LRCRETVGTLFLFISSTPSRSMEAVLGRAGPKLTHGRYLAIRAIFDLAISRHIPPGADLDVDRFVAFTQVTYTFVYL